MTKLARLTANARNQCTRNLMHTETANERKDNNLYAFDSDDSITVPTVILDYQKKKNKYKNVFLKYIN